MKEKTIYKTPSVRVVRLEVERVCGAGSDTENKTGESFSDRRTWTPADGSWQ